GSETGFQYSATADPCGVSETYRLCRHRHSSFPAIRTETTVLQARRLGCPTLRGCAAWYTRQGACQKLFQLADTVLSLTGRPMSSAAIVCALGTTGFGRVTSSVGAQLCLQPPQRRHQRRRRSVRSPGRNTWTAYAARVTFGSMANRS